MIAFAVVAGLFAGVVADHLEARLFPFADPGASFQDFGMRGAIVPGRLILAVGCGLLVGALVGRTLPAMILALVLGAMMVGAVDGVHQAIQVREAVPVDQNSIDERFAGRIVDFRYELASGDLVTHEELEALHPDPAELERQLQASRQLVFVTPGERYAQVSLREAAVTGSLGLLLVVATIPVVGRRDPGPGWVRIGLGRGVRTPRRRPGLPATGKPGPAAASRLALWPHRAELAGGDIVGLGVSLACVLVVGTLSSVAPPPQCLADLSNIPMTQDCATTDQFLLFASEWASVLFVAMAVLPWLVGTLIGVVIVGREIEHGTATLAWSLAPDRRRWLITRVAVAAALVVLLLAIPSILATEMQRIAQPWVPPESTFENYGLRGPLIVVRGVAAFGIALLVGALVGRILPGVLLAALGCVMLAILVSSLAPFGVAVDMARPVDPRAFSTPREHLGEVELREGVLLAASALAFLGASVAAVERRRPY
ncbi:MAG: hypothetical protein H0X16_07860 [Chloroflexi bacterium]|nr:hypothetical protein [Chloroflexota bacterium]